RAVHIEPVATDAHHLLATGCRRPQADLEAAPRLAERAGAERGTDGRLRHGRTVPARYGRPVPAKSPGVEVSVGERTVRVSNPDRVYFPATGATKLDLVEYYLCNGAG